MSHNIKIHQHLQNLCDFEGIRKLVVQELKNPLSEPILHIFPELFLCGYPVQDLCLQNSFIEQYLTHLERLNQSFQNAPQSEHLFLMGGLHYEFSKSGTPSKIENVIWMAQPGSKLTKIYSKMQLPNYDIFDERKYFTPGQESTTIKWQGQQIGLLICEDMWPSVHYSKNPLDLLSEEKEPFDLIVNMSASPYELRKLEKRKRQARTISHLLKAPLVYVNLVAEEDEILFDGGSFVLNGDEEIYQASLFEATTETIPWEKIKRKRYQTITLNVNHSWEDLFAPHLTAGKEPRLQALEDSDHEELIQALTFGIQEYARKNGFQHFLVALSGGIDSALTLALLKLSLKEGQTIEALYMPSQYSKTESYEYSEKLCKNLKIPLKSVPIKFLHSMVRNTFHMNYTEDFEGLADENVQARIRATLLMARSNQTGRLVVNTSNKSEIAVGYSTLYGDSVGAVSLIGDLYKTEVFSLCHYLNETRNDLIPQGIIDRRPSAELKENQYDTDSLPPYPILDTILECLLSYRYSKDDLVKMKLPEADIDKTLKLYTNSEYKRRQFCPIIKVKTKSFGFGYRVPINKSNKFYFS